MHVRKAQNLDKLAIVLSVAVITLALMAQTVSASGAAQANGNVDGDVCDASPTLDECDGDGNGGGGGGVGNASRTDDKPIPPGQLVRRGIFGTVLETGDGFVIIETKFGNVTINVEDSEGFEAGDRFAALLDKSPVPPGEAVESEDGSFRTVTARRVKGVPAQSSRNHLRAVVVDSSSGDDGGDGTDGTGTLAILDDDGNEIDLDTDGDTGAGDGEDTVLLVRNQGGGAPLRVLGTIPSFAVAERLERFRANASPEAVARIEALFLARAERIDARLQRLEDKAPPGLRATVRGARDKNENRGRGTSGGDDGDDGSGRGQPDGKGKPDDPGKPDGAGSGSSGDAQNQ